MKISFDDLLSQILPAINMKEKVEFLNTAFLECRDPRGDVGNPNHTRYIYNLLYDSEPIGIKAFDSNSKFNFFQYWDQKKYPKKIEYFIDRNRSAYKEKYSLYDYESAKNYINQNFEKRITYAFNLCWHPAMRSDFFRIAKLFIEGGFYCDIDDLPNLMESYTKDVNFIALSAITEINSRMYRGFHLVDGSSVLDNCYLTNSPILVSKRNPIIGLCLFKATFDLLYGQENLISIHGTTGPGLISTGIQVYYTLPNNKNVKFYTIDLNKVLILEPIFEYTYDSNDVLNWRIKNTLPSDFIAKRNNFLSEDDLAKPLG